ARETCQGQSAELSRVSARLRDCMIRGMDTPLPLTLAFDHVCTPAGWISPGVLEIDGTGLITDVRTLRMDARNACVEVRPGFALPALPNVHSHAFQRAMAGHAEHRSPGHAGDSFWTWREAMYDVAAAMTPAKLEATTTQLFAEMLEGGSTSVAEFHYLHHEPGGVAPSPPTAYADAILRAARQTGIAVTLCPVLYLHGGFEGPLQSHQARFGHPDVAAFVDLWLQLAERVEAIPHARMGLAFHSLRAVRPAEMQRCLEALGLTESGDTTPVHVHVAEQPLEVADCLRTTGKRPLELLLDEDLVDDRTCLVHATHLDSRELERATAKNAIAGLCPTTEANLGDGVFALEPWLAANGAFGIGSDSQICVDALHELNLLEYGQRLVHGKRCIAATADTPHVGDLLWDHAVRGGARAVGQQVAGIAAGQRADFVVLDSSHPRLREHGTSTIRDAAIFSRSVTPVIRETWRAGELLVSNGRHRTSNVDS
ncbi:MAG: formimidoylglutamate deiminase, partial [Planctomycetes bacterium]|nr:formimidoylglutamate deiminase [Planctomycetota bacterium]